MRGGVTVDRIPALKPILERVGIDKLPKANVAVLVGTAMDPTRRKNPANLPGYTVNTIWGEMAYQLVTSAGRPDLYAIIRDADRKGVSPGSENLKNLLNECGPCLILMDELVAYAKKIYGVDGEGDGLNTRTVYLKNPFKGMSQPAFAEVSRNFNTMDLIRNAEIIYQE